MVNIDTEDTLIEPHEAFEVLQTGDHSMMSNCRDTSTSPREVSDELRQSVNTHNSILDVTSDAEDSDDDADGYLFDDFEVNESMDSPPPNSFKVVLPEKQQLACCAPAPAQTPNVLTDWIKSSSSSFQSVTETMAQVFCQSEACGDAIDEVPFFMQHHANVLEVLGCLESPTADEMQAWSILHSKAPLFHKKRAPTKRSSRCRAARMVRVKQERAGMDPADLSKTKSMDDSLIARWHEAQEKDVSFQSAFGVSFFGDEDLDQVIGKGMEAIPAVEDDGYDSDPEYLPTNMPSTTKSNTISSPLLVVPDIMFNDELLTEMVEETLNYTWSLTYHTTAASTPVEVWMERGTILNMGTVIVEPKVMWREAFQGTLAKRKLSESSQHPWNVRLLNACRVIPLVDRTIYPLAHVRHSFVLKTCRHEEFVFEASSKTERDTIMTQWKVVIARLATLAVMEDMHTMAAEFFTPGSLSN
jgi:hypothetical protein